MPDSLHDRLGGGPAIEAVSTALYARIVDDDRLKWAFEGVNMERQVRRMCLFLAQATGGPASYSGPALDRVHARLHLTSREFDAVAGHLVAVLTELEVPQKEISEAMALVESTRSAIVTAPIRVFTAAEAAALKAGPARERHWLPRLRRRSRAH